MTNYIQLDAYVVPDDHAVWKCFPGKSYEFYDVVRETSMVFLDIRGLEALGPNPAVWDDKQALEVIAADRWQRELEKIARGAKSSGGPGVSAIDKRNLTLLKGLLVTAKKGDLVVVPSDSNRLETMIGEFADDGASVFQQKVKTKRGDAVFLGRRVKWRTFQPKRAIDLKLLARLHTPIAFFEIERSFYHDVYRMAYENYVYRGQYVSTFSTSKAHFTSADNLTVSIWFNGMAAVRHASETSNPTSIAGKRFIDVALMPTGAENQSELALNINSPGTIAIRSAGVFALALMALFPLSDAQAQSVAAGTTRVKIHAVGSASDECTLEVEAAVADYVKTLDPETLVEACEFARRAREEATLKADVRLIPGSRSPISRP